MKISYGLYMVMTNPVVGYEECARAGVRCGVPFIQLRMKNATRDEIVSEAWKVREVTRGTDSLFIVNDDVTIAKEVDADGVHLGQGDMSLAEARKIWNVPGKIFGLSTHSEKQAETAIDQKPDYIGIGPIFPTPTKAIADPDLGVERAGAIAKSTPLPHVVLGGIDGTNLAEILQAGAVNYCAVRAIMQSPEPEVEIRKLQNIWAEYIL
ncbi:thiamine phosphate synthase [Tichowtungia aerotolerans]|uniref:Thiamine-phosphate synthase n=1 Tax=Tichowtungia aerotolerans TaxID=2697043 RepID=A0A6P1M6L5_9BACT|nr:thiamine phosphate synthase [Tichowtungia aerotolerans]QHI69497.1 thiamine phosphate synthase [Tichowtungia aerotolerans]